MNYNSYNGRTRVKICGFTRAEDAVQAAFLGVDAIGLVFYPPSPRSVDIDAARKIALEMPPFVSVVGLFVDERAERINEVLEKVPLDLIQFHGSESVSDCSRFGMPYIKAVRMRPDIDVNEVVDCYSSARGLLLDAYQEDAKGGTGASFEWSRVPGDSSAPFVLAGGLTPENVYEALTIANVYAVDVSSGVEFRKGIKDDMRIAELIKEVNRFDRTKQ